MIPLVLVFIVKVAPLLTTLLDLILKISGFMDEAELSEVLLLIITFVIFLPTSAKLHVDANCVNLILKGGNNTLYVGSWSKHNVIVGVVKLCIIVYTLVKVNVNVNGGGTYCSPWVIVNEKLVCWGTILIIRGVKLKLDKNLEYCDKVWFDYSDILMNNVIYVDEGNENKIGTMTDAPLVDIEMDGTVIVGETNVADDEGLITCIVVGKMFLKYVWTSDSNLLKLIV